jgi:hypothetical protein
MLDGETPGYIGRAEENRRRNLPDTGEKGRASRRGWSWEPPWRHALSNQSCCRWYRNRELVPVVIPVVLSTLLREPVALASLSSVR